MLKELRIKNIALIDTLELEFKKGLNILTGETGAGKSILIDALGLALGDRTTAEWLRTGEDTGEIEAVFAVSDLKSASRFFENAGIEAEDEMIFRRVFSRSGRNRCFINGVSVTLSFCKKAGEMLVDIHGQNDHQALLSPENQITALDAFAGTESFAVTLEKKVEELKKVERELSSVRQSETNKAKQIDLLRFEQDEIKKAELSEEEEEELKREKQLLQNAEKRNLLGRDAYELIYNGEGAAQEKLNQALSALENIQRIDDSLNSMVENLKVATYSLEDISLGLRDYLDNMIFDPERLAEIDDRLAMINQLKRKYGDTIKSILEKKSEIERELEEFEGTSERAGLLEEKVKKLQSEISLSAVKLAERREKSGKSLGSKMEQQLKDLKMNKVQFSTHFVYEDDPESFVSFQGARVKLFSNGIGKMEFYLLSNVGEKSHPLARIASGGELSRIMLSLKNVLTGKDYTPVLIFDEVDAGIGGGVADVVGQKIKNVAKEHQVFCITHLPQIASRGDSHFFVKKKTKANRTTVEVRELSGEERVEEIARMAGGVVITDITRKHAREMINRV